MDILFRRGRATAADVMTDLPGSLSDSTVRTHLRILEEKGHVRHEEEGLRFVFMPTASKSVARRSALKHLIDTFYDGSTEKVVAALIGAEATRVSRGELKRIADLLDKARKEEERR